MSTSTPAQRAAASSPAPKRRGRGCTRNGITVLDTEGRLTQVLWGEHSLWQQTSQGVRRVRTVREAAALAEAEGGSVELLVVVNPEAGSGLSARELAEALAAGEEGAGWATQLDAATAYGRADAVLERVRSLGALPEVVRERAQIRLGVDPSELEVGEWLAELGLRGEHPSDAEVLTELRVRRRAGLIAGKTPWGPGSALHRPLSLVLARQGYDERVGGQLAWMEQRRGPLGSALELWEREEDPQVQAACRALRVLAGFPPPGTDELRHTILQVGALTGGDLIASDEEEAAAAAAQSAALSALIDAHPRLRAACGGDLTALLVAIASGAGEEDAEEIAASSAAQRQFTARLAAITGAGWGAASVLRAPRREVEEAVVFRRVIERHTRRVFGYQAGEGVSEPARLLAEAERLLALPGRELVTQHGTGTEIVWAHLSAEIGEAQAAKVARTLELDQLSGSHLHEDEVEARRRAVELVRAIPVRTWRQARAAALAELGEQASKDGVDSSLDTATRLVSAFGGEWPVWVAQNRAYAQAEDRRRAKRSYQAAESERRRRRREAIAQNDWATALSLSEPGAEPVLPHTPPSLHDLANWLPGDPETAQRFGAWVRRRDLHQALHNSPRSRKNLQQVARAFDRVGPELQDRPLQEILLDVRTQDYGSWRGTELALVAAECEIDADDLEEIGPRWAATLELPTPFPLEDSWSARNDSGLTGRFLPRHDPRGLFLGEYTDCCQHPDGAGEECAWAGQEQANMGFFVVEDSEGAIVAQSWAWVDGSGRLCFDNVEGRFSELAPEEKSDRRLAREAGVREVYEEAADALLERFTAVTVGLGLSKLVTADLPDADALEADAPSAGYTGYRDSDDQVLLAAREAGDLRGYVRASRDDVEAVIEVASTNGQRVGLLGAHELSIEDEGVLEEAEEGLDAASGAGAVLRSLVQGQGPRSWQTRGASPARIRAGLGLVGDEELVSTTSETESLRMPQEYAARQAADAADETPGPGLMQAQRVIEAHEAEHARAAAAAGHAPPERAAHDALRHVEDPEEDGGRAEGRDVRADEPVRIALAQLDPAEAAAWESIGIEASHDGDEALRLLRGAGITPEQMRASPNSLWRTAGLVEVGIPAALALQLQDLQQEELAELHQAGWLREDRIALVEELAHVDSPVVVARAVTELAEATGSDPHALARSAAALSRRGRWGEITRRRRQDSDDVVAALTALAHEGITETSLKREEISGLRGEEVVELARLRRERVEEPRPESHFNPRLMLFWDEGGTGSRRLAPGDARSGTGVAALAAARLAAAGVSEERNVERYPEWLSVAEVVDAHTGASGRPVSPRTARQYEGADLETIRVLVQAGVPRARWVQDREQAASEARAAVRTGKRWSAWAETQRAARGEQLRAQLRERGLDHRDVQAYDGLSAEAASELIELGVGPSELRRYVEAVETLSPVLVQQFRDPQVVHAQVVAWARAGQDPQQVAEVLGAQTARVGGVLPRKPRTRRDVVSSIWGTMGVGEVRGAPILFAHTEEEMLALPGHRKVGGRGVAPPLLACPPESVLRVPPPARRGQVQPAWTRFTDPLVQRGRRRR